jgi:hypothetical protein
LMQMMVDNVDAWWKHIEALDLPKLFVFKHWRHYLGRIPAIVVFGFDD